MATELIQGVRTYSMQRDADGYREYKLTHLVRAGVNDGPFNVLNTPGLPLPGSAWIIGNDVDLWSWCRPDAVVTIHQEKEGDANLYWRVEQTFSNKPLPRDSQRCQDVAIEDPLLEPQRVSGSFTKFTEEATTDRDGNPIKNSAHEPIRGVQAEFDQNRPNVRIEQNVAVLDLALCTSMVDTVNDGPLWGLPERCIKLSNFSWERRFYGLCYIYYVRSFEFDINFNTFDKDLLDEGTKVLNGDWDNQARWQLKNLGDLADIAPDPANPGHFKQILDKDGNLTRFILNGAGLPAEVEVVSPGGVVSPPSDPGTVHVERYPESNFLLLGIPVIF